MNYFNQKCPHCHKAFNKEDDIVVCPVCGTPQHRECYEEENKCVNHEKHSTGYEWQPNENEETNEAFEIAENINETITCGNCGTKNSGDSFFCKHCSTPLGNNTFSYQSGSTKFSGTYVDDNQPNNNQFNGMPISVGFDIINDEDEIAPNVKIKEAKSYIKNNTFLYTFIFKRIHDHNKSRFNFAAFLFSGGWFLYRKQYALGTILTILFAICLCGYALTAPGCYKQMMDFASSIGVNDEHMLYTEILKLPFDQAMPMLFSGVFELGRYILMIISGFIANRCYYKHVVKNVVKAKETYQTEVEVNAHLESKGGVDKVLGYVLLAGYFILSILPSLMIAGIYI